ncbi:putative spindle and kinetochore-associated protein [Helianthus debilis subsp. tardiflorus]
MSAQLCSFVFIYVCSIMFICEKKGRGSPPVWYITADELDSLSSYMRGRLTLDKINAAINDMAAYAEANSQLMTAPRKKEIRDIGATEGVKGKHFFLETDVKGPTLKLDNTGKAIFTESCLSLCQLYPIQLSVIYWLSVPCEISVQNIGTNIFGDISQYITDFPY